MADFLAVAFDFPAILFTLLLIVTICFWLLVLLGVLDADTEIDADGGFLSGFGFGGVPVTIVLSVLVVVGWFISLAGTVWLDHAGVGSLFRVALAVGMLLAAVVGGGLVARLLVRPLRRLFGTGAEASRNDFVGSLCTIRTSRVTVDFGQAEVTAADGSSAIIQVRQAGDAPLGVGSTAVIYDYDADGEFFWVTPVELGTNHPIPRS